MGYFSETQAAIAVGEAVAMVVLAQFDFEEGTERVWQGGIGKIIAGGEEWLGLGTLGSISDMQIGAGDAAAITTFMLSGVDPDILALARQSASVRGRQGTIYGCFLAAPKRVLDELFYVDGGLLDVLSYAASGPRNRTITMTMESEFSDRATSAFALYSARDAVALGYPTERGFDFMPELTAGARVHWPF